MSDVEPLHDSPKFRFWKQSLADHGCELNGVEPLHTVRKRDGSILFALLHADAVAPEGHKLLPVAMLRGHFVSVLTCLVDRVTGERFLVLVRQRRVANGALFYEHPAGMMDQSADPVAVALAELREETGLVVDREELVQLNVDPLYSSPGLLDEGGYFFYVEKEMDRSQIDSYDNRATGDGGEGEHIVTRVVRPAEAYHLIKNTNGLLHLFLYEAHKMQFPPDFP